VDQQNEFEHEIANDASRHALIAVTLSSGIASSVHGQDSRLTITSDDPASLETQEIQPFCCEREHLEVAGPQLLALQIIPWYFNRHVADDRTADLSLNSWHRNIQLGFEWDPNSFRTNMFDHPFYGTRLQCGPF
jgi:hypothetical protein